MEAKIHWNYWTERNEASWLVMSESGHPSSKTGTSSQNRTRTTQNSTLRTFILLEQTVVCEIFMALNSWPM